MRYTMLPIYNELAKFSPKRKKYITFNDSLKFLCNFQININSKTSIVL